MIIRRRMIIKMNTMMRASLFPFSLPSFAFEEGVELEGAVGDSLFGGEKDVVGDICPLVGELFGVCEGEEFGGNCGVEKGGKLGFGCWVGGGIKLGGNVGCGVENGVEKGGKLELGCWVGGGKSDSTGH